MRSLRTNGTGTSYLTAGGFGELKFACIGFFRIAVNTGTYAICIEYSTGGSTYHLGTDSDGASLTLHVAGGSGNLATGVNIADGRWWALGFECNGSNLVRLYYGRVGAPALKMAQGTTIATDPGTVVGIASPGFPWNGNAAGVRWWRNRTLGPARMAQEARSLRAESRAGLVGEWLLQDASYRDTSGFARHMSSGGGTLALETGPPLAYRGKGPIRKRGRIWLVDTTASGDSGSLAAASDGGVAALAGTTTVTGSLAASSSGGQMAISGTSTVTGSLAASGDGQISIVGAAVYGDLAASSGGGALAAAGTPVVTGSLGATGGGTVAMTGSTTETGALTPSGAGTMAIAGTSTITGDLAAANPGGRASIQQTNGAAQYEDEWHPDGNLGAAVWRPDYYAEPLLP